MQRTHSTSEHIIQPNASGGRPNKWRIDALTHSRGLGASDIWIRELQGSTEFVVGFASQGYADAEAALTDHGGTFFGIYITAAFSGANLFDFPLVGRTRDNIVPLRVTRSSDKCQIIDGSASLLEGDVPAGLDMPHILTYWGDTKIRVGVTVKVGVAVDDPGKSSSRGQMALELRMAQRLFQGSKFTDATIKCSGREFNVHRAVLSTSSEVFDKMFSSGMREGAEAVVEIEDAAPEAVEAFIEGMYCGTMPEKHLLPSFVFLANKYMTQELAAAAMKIMIENVDISTVSDSVQTLRRFAEEESGSDMWSMLLEKLRADEAMLRTALEELADGLTAPAPSSA